MLSLVSFLHFAAGVGSANAENDRPIIGILTQPLGVELAESSAGSVRSLRTYIAASYVRFVESAGARAVPLHFDAPHSELTELFEGINGILFPGGGTSIKKQPGNRFRDAAELLYGLALKSNDRGDTFPIHGTCLGFQMLNLLAAGDDGVLCESCYKTFGTPLPLDLAPAANSSALFSAMPPSLVASLTSQNITENSHQNGIEPMKFEESERLKAFFKVLSTNSDPSTGRQFVSTIEAWRYPISGTQWHPEKSNFEWGKIGKAGYAAIPHSPAAISLSQYMADNFVNRARQNSHRFPSEEAETQALIYNYAPVEDPNGYYSQIYLWNRDEQDSASLIV